MHPAFPGSPLEAREKALLSVLCNFSKDKKSEITQRALGWAGGGGAEEERWLGQWAFLRLWFFLQTTA